MPAVTVPALLVHPTGDTEIRIRQAREIASAAGGDDVTYHEMKGAPHYLEGHRPAAMSDRRPTGSTRASPSASRARRPTDVAGHRGRRTAATRARPCRRRARCASTPPARGRRRPRRRRCAVDRVTRLEPSKERSIANAWPKRPGPAVRSRSRRAATRRLRMTSRPRTGAAARNRTAWACAPGRIPRSCTSDCRS